MSENGFKSGFVSIIGKPNAGKSTLMNALVGRKLSITTPKAQTTRHRILGIASGENYQIVFSDTPGVILPQYKLHRMMMGSVHASLEDADLFLLLVDVNEKFPEDLVIKMAQKSQVPVLLVLNKVDKGTEAKVFERHAEITSKVKVERAIGISATQGINLHELKQMIIDLLPEGPQYFDPGDLSDRPDRFFVSELIRESIFIRLKDEVPYSCEVTILQLEEKDVVTVIHAEIHVERQSQKGILVGKGGRMIKEIGMHARRTIEAFLEKNVYLELHVRVAEGWKDSSFRLKDFGFRE
ncbi:MAG: GTPase Era [Bacteroidota bacterium]